MSAWGKPAGTSSWADEVDEHAKQNEDDFPTLGAAASNKTAKKGDKGAKKMQKLTLNEFLTTPAAAPTTYQAPGRSAPPADDPLMDLPKAPRARDPNAPPEEDLPRGPRGGGFRDREGGGFDRERGERGERGGRGGRGRPDRDDGPSRAEASDNWGSDRKFVPTEGGAGGRGGFGGGFRDRERSGGFRDRAGPGPSRADEEDMWGKKFVPTEGGRDGGRDGRDREGGGRGFGRAGPGPSRADEEDRWGHKWEPSKSASPAPEGGRGSWSQRVRKEEEDENGQWKKAAPPAEAPREKEREKSDRRRDEPPARPGIDDDRWGKKEPKGDAKKVGGGSKKDLERKGSGKKEDKVREVQPISSPVKTEEGEDGFVVVSKK